MSVQFALFSDSTVKICIHKLLHSAENMKQREKAARKRTNLLPASDCVLKDSLLTKVFHSITCK